MADAGGVKETKPYTEAVDAELIASGAGSVLDSELFSVTLRGWWTLSGDAEPRVRGFLDAHPVLDRMLAVALGRVFVKRSTIHLTASAWTQMRRGLLLCASEVVDGEIVARHDSGSEVAFPAAGDTPRASIRHTAELPTARVERPGR